MFTKVTEEEQKKQAEQLAKLTMKVQVLINVGGEFYDKNDNLLENDTCEKLLAFAKDSYNMFMNGTVI